MKLASLLRLGRDANFLEGHDYMDDIHGKNLPEMIRYKVIRKVNYGICIRYARFL